MITQPNTFHILHCETNEGCADDSFKLVGNGTVAVPGIDAPVPIALLDEVHNEWWATLPGRDLTKAEYAERILEKQRKLTEKI